MKELLTRKKYFLLYSILFLLLCVSVYGYFWFTNKSFIPDINAYTRDGLIQHYNALCYYATYLRNIIKTLIYNHKLVIPEWSFSIGYGSNILTSLHYYVIGDPFNLLSVLVPTRYMPYYYSFMILFRMYCAGVAFSAYGLYMVKEKKEYNYYSVLAGAIVYVFCMYGMKAGITHPYFINPMVFFPLLLLGVEKIIKRENPILFMSVVAVSACSNFYFFYMLVILVVIYVLTRLFTRYGYKQLKIIGIYILRISGYSVIGLGAGMILFLPVIMAVFSDSRFGNGTPLQILFDLKYYTSFPGSFISMKSGGNWCVLGFAAISMVAILLMMCNVKRHKVITLAFVVSTISLMIPAANYILNAFSYAACRWIWAYSLLISYIVMRMWPKLHHMSFRQTKWVFVLLLGYFLICLLLEDSRTENMALSVICAFAILCVLQLDMDIRWKERAVLLLVALNVGINGHFMSSLQSSDLLNDYADWEEVNSFVFDTFDDAVAEASADDSSSFFRFCQEDFNNNTTLLSGLYSTQYYWSLSNSSIIEANNELGILEFTHNMYYDWNSRVRLTNMANIKYFLAPSEHDGMRAPYDFEYIGTYKGGEKHYDIYKNKNPLPFGYTYDSVLDSEKFEDMSSVQKEEALFQSAYIADEKTELPTNKASLTSKSVPYSMTCTSDDITYKDNSFIVTKKNASVILNFDGLKMCETNLQINGLKYRGCSPLDLYEENSEFDPTNQYSCEKWENMSVLEQKELKHKYRNWKQEEFLNLTVTGKDDKQHSLSEGVWLLNPGYTWYSGKEDFTVNLRYSDEKRGSIEIFFPCEGIYSFDNLRIECLPIQNYYNDLNMLRNEAMENVNFTADCITGNIFVNSPKLLCLTIPYEKGWKAYVDGKEQQIIKTNYMYSGIVLSQGQHEIKLVYHTPGLRIGLIISLVCGIISIGLGLKHEKTGRDYLL